MWTWEDSPLEYLFYALAIVWIWQIINVFINLTIERDPEGGRDNVDESERDVQNLEDLRENIIREEVEEEESGIPEGPLFEEEPTAVLKECNDSSREDYHAERSDCKGQQEEIWEEVEKPECAAEKEVIEEVEEFKASMEVGPPFEVVMEWRDLEAEVTQEDNGEGSEVLSGYEVIMTHTPQNGWNTSEDGACVQSEEMLERDVSSGEKVILSEDEHSFRGRADNQGEPVQTTEDDLKNTPFEVYQSEQCPCGVVIDQDENPRFSADVKEQMKLSEGKEEQFALKEDTSRDFNSTSESEEDVQESNADREHNPLDVLREINAQQEPLVEEKYMIFEDSGFGMDEPKKADNPSDVPTEINAQQEPLIEEKYMIFEDSGFGMDEPKKADNPSDVPTEINAQQEPLIEEKYMIFEDSGFGMDEPKKADNPSDVPTEINAQQEPLIEEKCTIFENRDFGMDESEKEHILEGDVYLLLTHQDSKVLQGEAKATDECGKEVADIFPEDDCFNAPESTKGGHEEVSASRMNDTYQGEEENDGNGEESGTATGSKISGEETQEWSHTHSEARGNDIENAECSEVESPPRCVQEGVLYGLGSDASEDDCTPVSMGTNGYGEEGSDALKESQEPGGEAIGDYELSGGENAKSGKTCTAENDKELSPSPGWDDMESNAEGRAEGVPTGDDGNTSETVPNISTGRELTTEDLATPPAGPRGRFIVHRSETVGQCAYEERNLLKNNCGQEDFCHWKLKPENDGWTVGDCLLLGEKHPAQKNYGDPLPEFGGHSSYFETVSRMCKKEQMIDLITEGFDADMLDTSQPSIEISEWISSRPDCRSTYELRVRLLNGFKVTVSDFQLDHSFSNKQETSWKKVQHVFKNYGAGVRYVSFSHGAVKWFGKNGCRMTDGVVRLLPKKKKSEIFTIKTS